ADEDERPLGPVEQFERLLDFLRLLKINAAARYPLWVANGRSHVSHVFSSRFTVFTTSPGVENLHPLIAVNSRSLRIRKIAPFASYGGNSMPNSRIQATRAACHGSA